MDLTRPSTTQMSRILRAMSSLRYSSHRLLHTAIEAEHVRCPIRYTSERAPDSDTDVLLEDPRSSFFSVDWLVVSKTPMIGTSKGMKKKEQKNDNDDDDPIETLLHFGVTPLAPNMKKLLRDVQQEIRPCDNRHQISPESELISKEEVIRMINRNVDIMRDKVESNRKGQTEKESPVSLLRYHSYLLKLALIEGRDDKINHKKYRLGQKDLNDLKMIVKIWISSIGCLLSNINPPLGLL